MDPPALKWNPPKQLRAPKIPEEEWEKHRVWIFDLHENGNTLEEIMAVLRYHGIQEGTFFEPTRKQYVSQLKNWGLRKYGLQQNTRGLSSGPAAGAKQSHGSSRGRNSLIKSLQHHQWRCLCCRATSCILGAIQNNTRLAANCSAPSEQEICQKLDLAEFYLAAKALDDAWVLYAEILYRSQKCCDAHQLLIALEILYSSIRFHEQMTARVHFAFLFLTSKDDSGAATEPFWMMHLLRALVFRTRRTPHLASQHVQKAVKLRTAASLLCQARIERIHRQIDAKMLGQAVAASCRMDISFVLQRAGLAQTYGMETLLNWCLEQVKGDGYHEMLSSARAKPWTRAPCLQSFEDFESITLFCYLWQRYRSVTKAFLSTKSPAAEKIIQAINSVELDFRISAQMIFSVVSSMRADTGTVSFAIKCADFSLEQIARQAVINVKTAITLSSDCSCYRCFCKDKFTVSNKNCIALGADIDATEQQNHFREVVLSFVRQFSGEQFPQRTLNQHLGGSEAYMWSTTPLASIVPLADDANVETDETGETESGQGSLVISVIRTVHSAVQPASSTSPPPTPIVRPMSGTLPTICETDERPTSTVSVDMFATPRSSLSSSKASLRSFQRFGRGVTELLLKRGGSGANQLPSEAMDRDSQSSWSLHRLTGVSYLSATSEITADGETEEDAVMEDVPL